MNTEKYWANAALLREIAVQEGATASAADILRLYNEALSDIEDEIKSIEENFKRRFGLDNDTAAYFLTRAQEEENLRYLIEALEAAPDEKARQNVLDYIRLDGLSVRAYAARIERYDSVKTAIFARIKKLAASEIGICKAMLKNAYKESYYGVMDDTAKGLDVGISFCVLDDRAIEEAVNTKWHGKRFSQRIWKNTDRLAQEAQELTVKALMSGESLTKTAAKLSESFETAKYNSVTLIHTETAHIHAMADKRAYEELGFEEYKYLATLDYVTCERCQSLDGMVFSVKDAHEGVNYPVMHPRCRCTTTANINYGKRRARDPITGKNELVDGDTNYRDWYNSLSDEQKNALLTARKKDTRKTADKLQYEKYKKVIGKENMPKTFDKFQDLKYNNGKEWDALKKRFAYTNKPYVQKQLVYTLPNGEKGFIPAKATIKSVKTIAGANSSTKLRVEERLIELYGGQTGEWEKKVGKVESDKYIFDVHWYELNGKQYEAKVKHGGNKK